MTLSAEIEPGPHWWKASALTTVGQPCHHLHGFQHLAAKYFT